MTLSDDPSDKVRQPRSVRFLPEEWDRLDEAAALFGLETAVFLRRIALRKLSELQAEIDKRRDQPKDQELF